MAKELRPEDAAAQRLLADAVRNSGRSQDSIGKEVGISQNRVSTILRGATPPVTVGELLAIAAAVGVSGAEIIEKAATEARLAASAQAAPEPEVVRIPVMGDVDFEPIPPSEEKMLALAANATAEDLERSRLEEIGEESQLPPEEWDE